MIIIMVLLVSLLYGEFSSEKEGESAYYSIRRVQLLTEEVEHLK